jgi:hypothetical protein
MGLCGFNWWTELWIYRFGVAVSLTVKSYLQKAFCPLWYELSFPRRRESIVPSCILAISHRLKDTLSLRAANGSVQPFRIARIASQEGCRALLAITVEPFWIARKAKHKKAQWIPACAGMTVHTGNDNLRWQGKETLFKQPLRLCKAGLFKLLCLKYTIRQPEVGWLLSKCFKELEGSADGCIIKTGGPKRL